MAGKGMNHPYPCLEVIIHIQTRAGDLHLIKTFGSGERQARQFFRRISPGKRVFLLFFSDLSVGTNTPSRISATGCTVLLALGVRFTTSPEDLSTSSNSFLCPDCPCPDSLRSVDSLRIKAATLFIRWPVKRQTTGFSLYTTLMNFQGAYSL